MKPSFSRRGVEQHSATFYDKEAMRVLIEKLQDLQMNMLVFHLNNILDDLALYEEYPNLARKLKYLFPNREKQVLKRREDVRWLADTAEKHGMNLYLMCKELQYPPILVKAYPEVKGEDYDICLSKPFIWNFTEAKVKEVLEALPEIKGIGMSPGTHEGHVSVLQVECNCPECERYKPVERIRDLILHFYKPVHAAGKELHVRTFIYTPWELDIMLGALLQTPEDIIAWIKYTPHDYWPTFPHHPAIGNVGKHPQIIEFDVWGEYHGMSIIPCCMPEHLQYRLRYAKEKGAVGFVTRGAYTALGTLNEVNLIAMAKLGLNIDADLDEMWKEWATEKFGSKAAPHMIRALKKTFPIMMKTGYFKGYECFRNTGISSVIRHIFGRNSILLWDPTKEKWAISSEESLKEIIDEKEEALKLCAEMIRDLEKAKPYLDEATYTRLERTFEKTVDWAKVYRYYIEAFFRYCLAEKTKDPKQFQLCLEAANKLDKMRKYLKVHYYLEPLVLQLDLETFLRDLEIHLAWLTGDTTIIKWDQRETAYTPPELQGKYSRLP